MIALFFLFSLVRPGYQISALKKSLGRTIVIIAFWIAAGGVPDITRLSDWMWRRRMRVDAIRFSIWNLPLKRRKAGDVYILVWHVIFLLLQAFQDVLLCNKLGFFRIY